MNIVKKGATDVTRYVLLVDSAAGTPETAYTITNLDLQYTRNRTAPATKVDATALAATDSAHADNKAIEIDATSSPGLYRIDWPDAAFATGADKVLLVVSGTGLHPAVEEIQLVNYDPEDAVRLGLTALPNAAADAAGGLPISDAGGLDLDAQRSDVAAILVDTGTTLDGRIPAALIAGRMDCSVGAMAANVLTAAAIAANAIDADALATDAKLELAAGVWDALTADYTTVGSFGAQLGAGLVATIWQATSRTLTRDDHDSTPKWYVKTVANGGSDSNDGRSWNAAKATIAATITAAASGDRIYLGAGTWTEELSSGDKNLQIVGQGYGVSIIAPISGTTSVLAMGAGSLTLERVAVHSTTHAYLISTALVSAEGHLRIIDCELLNTTNNGEGVHFHAAVGHLEIRNSRADVPSGTPIYVEDGEDVYIDRCSIKGRAFGVICTAYRRAYVGRSYIETEGATGLVSLAFAGGDDSFCMVELCTIRSRVTSGASQATGIQEAYSNANARIYLSDCAFQTASAAGPAYDYESDGIGKCYYTPGCQIDATKFNLLSTGTIGLATPATDATINVNVEQWNNTDVPAEHTAGYPIVTIKDGIGTGEINTNAGAVALVDLVTTVTTLTNKTGFSLAATGLDSITATDPGGVASTLPQMLVQLWRRFFKKADKSATQIKTYADDGTTVRTTQTISVSGSDETQGAAS